MRTVRGQLATIAAIAATVGLAGLPIPGCGSVDLGETPGEINACRPDVDFFVARIQPELLERHGCQGSSGCHDVDTGRSPFRMRTLTSPAPPPGTARTLLPPDWRFNYEQAALETDCASPLDSPLLVKPEQGGPSMHGGGDLFPRGGPEGDLIRQWVK